MDRRTVIKVGGGAALLGWPAVQAAARRSVDFYLTRLTYESGDWDAYPRAAGQVLAALAAVSTLRVDPVERVVALANPRMLEAPLCVLCGHQLVQFSAAERRNLERFVRGGGLLLADDAGANPRGLFARSFEAEMERMFGARALAPLAPAHALSTSFFKTDTAGLRAITLQGRVRVLYSNRNLSGACSEGQHEARRLAVNIIHYALGA